MNYYSALYIPYEQEKPITEDKAARARIQSALSGALKKAKVSRNNFSLPDLSKNLTILATTELTQRYVVAGLSSIINGEPITSKTVLDTLFNTYAPAFNGMLEQMGYNSLIQMKNAVSAGSINVANFLQGFSRSLAVVTETFFNDTKMEKYGEELPIDVVESFKSEYKSNVAVHPFSEGVHIADYIKNIGSVKLIIKAHVRNNAAEIWSMGDFSNKINDARVMKKPVVFRIGRTIYENVLITEYTPLITNIYDLSFTLNLSYNSFLGRSSRRNSKGYHIINANVNQEIVNMLAQEEYVGQGKVEEVTIEDTAMIEAFKKAMNLTKVKVQGEYI